MNLGVALGAWVVRVGHSVLTGREREVLPLGANRAEPIDVRLVSATNMPRQEMGREERFRQDLLFRLNTVEITLPPLRERREDIPELALHYADHYAKKYQQSPRQFSDAALQALQAYDWPGNIRALRHALDGDVGISKIFPFCLVSAFVLYLHLDCGCGCCSTGGRANL